MPIYQPYLNAIQRYFDFVGRTGRREFWTAYIPHLILGWVIFQVLDQLIFGAGTGEFQPLTTIYGLGTLLPFLGLGARRLHDTGRSGWWQLLIIAVVIGWIVLVIFWIAPGDPDENAHGMPPMSADDMDMDPGMDSGTGMMQQ